MARKKDMPCASCGALMWGGGKGSLPLGLATCQSCRRSSVEHGSRRMYRERGCRCDACKAWCRESMQDYVDRARLRDGFSPWQKRTDPARRRHPGSCSKCHRELPAGTTIPDPVCAPCRGNLPGYKIAISREGRLDIYERDGWTCQICLEQVDRNVDPNSTWGATLDHIVPRANGGTDDRENLRLAHRWCNSVRGDLRYYTDADLQVA